MNTVKLKDQIRYWDIYYKNNNVPLEPTSFAKYCLPLIKKKSNFLELGCGNGRDSIFFARNNTKLPFYFSIISVIINILISVSLFSRFGFVIIPIATSISSWINVFLHFYFIKKMNFHNFDSKFIYKFPRMILSVVVMGIILYLLLAFFSDKFNYNESWKFIYLFIIVIISLFSYLLISNFSGVFKFRDIKLK